MSPQSNWESYKTMQYINIISKYVISLYRQTNAAGNAETLSKFSCHLKKRAAIYVCKLYDIKIIHFLCQITDHFRFCLQLIHLCLS